MKRNASCGCYERVCYDVADDCALSDWSEWSLCDCSVANARQRRRRDVIRDARAGGRACDALQEETRDCRCHVYNWLFLEKSDCITNSTDECGDGSCTIKIITSDNTLLYSFDVILLRHAPPPHPVRS